MKRLEFTLWPWRLLTYAVLAMAFTAAFIEAGHSNDTKDIVTVFLSVLTAGNAYLLAIAVGDFGRSIIAVPFGALVGFLAVRIFAYPLISAAFLFSVVIFLGPLIHEVMPNILGGFGAGCLVQLSSIFGGFLFLEAAFTVNREVGWLSLWCAYPFACACITAMMSLQGTISGVWHAGIGGLSAAFWGLVVGSLVSCLGGICLSPILGRAPGFDGLSAAVSIFGALVAQQFCMAQIFASLYRVQPPPPVPPKETGPPTGSRDDEQQANGQR